MNAHPPAGRMPVLETVRAGFDHLRSSFKVMALPTALTAAVQAAVLAVGAGAGGGAPALTQLLLLLTTALLVAPLQAAHYRRALGIDAGKLRLGREEMLLVGASLTYAFFLFIVIVIGAFLFSAVAAMLLVAAGVDVQSGSPEEVARSLGPQGTLILLALAVPGVLGLLYVQSRLVTFGPATVAEGRIMVFSTWGWTKGNGWRVLLATIALSAPLYLVLLTAGAFMAPLFLGGQTPQEARGPGLALFEFARSFLALWLIGAAVWGQQAYFYKGLKPV